MGTIYRCRCLVFSFIVAGMISGCGAGSISGGNDSVISVNDVFVDGDSASIIVTRKRTVRGSTPGVHSGGYLISTSEKSWLVDYPINNDSLTAKAPIMCFLGDFEQQRSNRGTKIEVEQGFPGRALFAYDDREAVIVRGNELRIYLNGAVETSKYQPHESESAPFVFTRDRKNVFVWHPEPAIYSIPEMEIIKKIAPTEEFSEFKTQFSERENRRSSLNTVSE